MQARISATKISLNNFSDSVLTSKVKTDEKLVNSFILT